MLEAHGTRAFHNSAATSEPTSTTISLISAEVSKYRISGAALQRGLRRWRGPALALDASGGRARVA
jgi:hypothetical protein